MKSFSSWTLEHIRKDIHMSWLEEKRLDWISTIAPSLDSLVNARTILLITDNKREWLGEYIIKKLNRESFDRPLLPIMKLDSLFGHIDSVDDEEKLLLLDDMLSLLFVNGYSFFYIGNSSDKRSSIAKHKDDSMIWFLDNKIDGSLFISAKDERIDEKLIELVNLYDKSIDAILFGEVDLQGAL